MQQFRDLKLIGNPSELEKAIENVETSLYDGWTRAKDKEANLKSKLNEDQFIFLSPKNNSIPRSALHLTFDQNGYLYVCNIIPIETDQLSEENYNLILENFHTKFIEPAVNDLDIRIVTTPEKKTLENSMNLELSIILKRFSDLANKSTGGTHPLDEKRLFDFIIQAHRESSLLDESTLRMLLLDEGWSEGSADKLSSKYCFGRDLLKQYDS